VTANERKELLLSGVVKVLTVVQAGIEAAVRVHALVGIQEPIHFVDDGSESLRVGFLLSHGLENLPTARFVGKSHELCPRSERAMVNKTCRDYFQYSVSCI
jgi:hypothetical protein